MENLNLLLKRLLEKKIDFVLIGGYAAVLYGASQVTQDLGILDILNEAKPVGSFAKIKQNSISINLFGYNCKVIALDDLIEIKKNMNRSKDQSTLQELLAIKEKLSPKA